MNDLLPTPEEIEEALMPFISCATTVGRLKALVFRCGARVCVTPYLADDVGYQVHEKGGDRYVIIAERFNVTDIKTGFAICPAGVSLSFDQASRAFDVIEAFPEWPSRAAAIAALGEVGIPVVSSNRGLN